MAEALLAAGMRVVVAGSSLDKVRNTFAAYTPRSCKAVAINLEDPDAPERLAADAGAAFGSIDVLVNNAGISTDLLENAPPAEQAPFLTIPAEFLERVYRINLIAPLRLTRALLPQMLDRRWGRVINISTGLGTMLAYSAYGGSKAALEAETASLATQLEGSGVTANMLLPGGAAVSNMTRRFAPETLLPASVMAGPIRYLASPESDGLNGRRIRAKFWDDSLPAAQAAAIAEPIAWKTLVEAQQNLPENSHRA
jgi:NAD(P)-dependent dehydrogenase (short-subunit alcohol dehydrogenase family)